jgi:uncharacterized membrane protein YphA (DoxX/SURF4 family)
MSIENSLDALHARVKQNRLLQYFTAFNRIILAVAFIPSGLTKVLGNRFTQLPLDNPIGFFFEAFYQTGGWYRFVGIAQVLAAILLLIPRTSTLGATIFFPIVLNIMIITISVGFNGTWLITSLMFLANLYLICWDYDKFKPLLPFSSGERKGFDLRRSLPLTLLGAVGGIMVFAFFAMINQGFAKLGLLAPVIGFFSGGVVGLLNAWQLQKN